jgi:hypothetical protein
MNAKFGLGAAFALLSLTSSAFGQTPAILGPAPDPRAPLRRAPLSMQEHRIPSGTPGFYDPSTRTFAPLVNESPAAAFQTFSGTVETHVAYQFSPDVHADDKVSCSLNVMYGTLFGGFFTLFHSESTVVSFRAGSPESVISLDFSYTDDLPNPVMTIQMGCFVRSGVSGEVFHETRIDLGFLPPQNGRIMIPVGMNL